MGGYFEYLGPIIPYTFGLYIFIITVVALIYNFRDRWPRRVEESLKQSFFTKREQRDRPDCHARFRAYFRGQSFECTYDSPYLRPQWRYALVVWRFIGFNYMFGVSFMWNYVNNPESAIFFTLWNVDILSLYFLLSFICSVIGLRHHSRYSQYGHQPSWDAISSVHGMESSPVHHPDPLSPAAFVASDPSASLYWSEPLQRLGYVVQMLFEVAGASAFFVTVVAFTTLDSEFALWNVSIHFVTSILMLGEALLNNMAVRWEHVALQVSWPVLYLIYCWPMTKEGVLNHWPYFFLNTDTVTIFIWYALLLGADMLFFGIFWLLNWWKRRYLTRLILRCTQTNNANTTNNTPQTFRRESLLSQANSMSIDHFI